MPPENLSPLSGEFRNPAREAAFQSERFTETRRHAKLLFVLSAILNTLFFISDWRFAGQPHFYVAIPARAVVVAISLLCWLALMRMRRVQGVQAVLATWQWINGAAVGVLVSSHSDIALFVVVMLPSIYYLVVPITFRWTLISGVGCSIMMLAGYVLPASYAPTVPGMILAMVTLNAALILVVSRSNRLRRLEWAATQSERRAKEELAQSRRMFEDMFMAVPIPLLVTSKADGRLLKANDAALTYFRADTDAPDIASIGEVYVDPAARAEFLEALATEGRVSGFEISVRLADGSIRDVLLAATSIIYHDTDSVMASVVDITSRKALEQHLERMATIDSLTGLANRRHFLELGAAEIERSTRHSRSLTVLMVDIDHFKRINDSYGHEGGDRALQAFADLSRDVLRQHDVAARLGGEEFAMLLPETDQVSAVHVAERIRQAAETLPLGDDRGMTVSIGVAGVRPTETDLTSALARADRALYVAKNRGRNRVVVHTDEMMDTAVFSAHVRL